MGNFDDEIRRMSKKNLPSTQESSPLESDDRPPYKRVRDTPRILAALKLAAEEAKERHRRAGVPIAVWENGQVKWVDLGSS